MLLCAGIVLGLLSMAGIFACLVGIIVTIAISPVGLALAYLQLTGQRHCLDNYTVAEPQP